MKKTTQLMEELNGSDDINSFLSNNKDSLDRQDFARYLCELVKKKKMTKIRTKNRGHKNIPAKSNIWISDFCRSKTSKQG